MLTRDFESVRRKIIEVAQRNGIDAIVTNQPTDWTIYDQIDLSTTGTATANQITFFQNTSSKAFPQSNLASNTLSGGQIVGLYGMVFTIHPATAGVFGKPLCLEQATGYEALSMLDASLIIANQQVISNLSGLKGMSTSNPSGDWGAMANGGTTVIINSGNSVISFDSVPVIMPNNTFTLNVTLPRYTPPAVNTQFLRCTLYGYGTIAAVANLKR